MSGSKNREVIVVTGASAGVGRAVVRAFADAGASIGLIGRGADGLEGARGDVEKRGGKALVVRADVSQADEVEAAATAVEKELGPIDVWVNNAMVSVFSAFKEMTAEEFKRVTEVTYLGYVYGTMSALKRMLKRNLGTIVQVGSALSYRSIPLQSAYCGGKHAVAGFTGSLRAELIHEKSRVRISMVNLPAVNTPQFNWVKSRLPRKPQPVPPIYQPEVAADAIVWAAHHAPRELNVGLSTSIVIWGNKFLPGFGDWYLGKTGFQSQQTEEEDDSRRPDNLWEPVSGDAGAHGRFDDRAHASSLQLWAKMHGGLLTLGGVLAASAYAWVSHWRRRAGR